MFECDCASACASELYTSVEPNLFLEEPNLFPEDARWQGDDLKFLVDDSREGVLRMGFATGGCAHVYFHFRTSHCCLVV